LSRDASQGISEYAPGAEVVANGRLWKSTGLGQLQINELTTILNEHFHWNKARMNCFVGILATQPYPDVQLSCAFINA
jgi:hypothetical protein